MVSPGRYRLASAELAPAALLFHSLSHPVRLSILQRLTRSEARVIDLVTELKLPQPTVSKHLARLRDCGLVDFREDGRQSYYWLSQPSLIGLLRSAEDVLDATENAPRRFRVGKGWPSAARKARRG